MCCLFCKNLAKWNTPTLPVVYQYASLGCRLWVCSPDDIAKKALLEQSGRCWYRTRDLHFPSLTPQTTHPPLGFPTGARKLQYLSCLASFGILRVAIENRMPWGQAKIKNASQNKEIEEEKKIFLLGKKKKKKFILALGEIRTGDLLHSSPAP